jgi:hypothetical protein
MIEEDGDINIVGDAKRKHYLFVVKLAVNTPFPGKLDDVNKYEELKNFKEEKFSGLDGPVRLK